MTRLATDAFTGQPWRIHEITGDFTVEDAPFRYLIVYPSLTRQWERAWLNRDRTETMPGHGRPR